MLIRNSSISAPGYQKKKKKGKQEERTLNHAIILSVVSKTGRSRYELCNGYVIKGCKYANRKVIEQTMRIVALNKEVTF